MIHQHIAQQPATPICTRTLKSLARVEKELVKLRGKEYDLPFGSMARARVSRKWDYYAQRKMALLATLESATAREVLNGMGDVK